MGKRPERSSYLGGPDVAAIVGVSKWATPTSVWLAKTGRAPAVHVTPQMRWGLRLERVVAEAFAEETGIGILQAKPVRHQELRHLGGSPDFLTTDDGILECKTSGSTAGWGSPYTEDVPEAYRVQTLWYMGLTGRHRGHLAALISGSDFRVYRVRWDQREFEQLAEAADRFWRDCVLADVPPNDSDWNRAQAYAHAEPALAPPLDATPEDERTVLELLDAKAALREAETRVEELEAALKSRMGDSSVLRLPGGGEVSWRRNRPAAVVDWQAIAVELGATDEHIAGHTTERPGARVFRIKIGS